MDNVYTLASYMRATRKPQLNGLFDDIGDLVTSVKDEALKEGIRELDRSLTKQKKKIVKETAKKAGVKVETEKAKNKKKVKELEDEKKQLDEAKKRADQELQIVKSKLKEQDAQKGKSTKTKIVIGSLIAGLAVGSYFLLKD